MTNQEVQGWQLNLNNLISVWNGQIEYWRPDFYNQEMVSLSEAKELVRNGKAILISTTQIKEVNK